MKVICNLFFIPHCDICFWVLRMFICRIDVVRSLKLNRLIHNHKIRGVVDRDLLKGGLRLREVTIDARSKREPRFWIMVVSENLVFYGAHSVRCFETNELSLPLMVETLPNYRVQGDDGPHGTN